MEQNLILQTDAYKVTHWMQYPEGTEYVYSYLESRSENKETLFFGLQYILKNHLSKPITQENIEEAEEFFQGVFGKNYFNRKGWQRILDVHNGFLPIVIKAVPEGSVVPTRNVLCTVENTDPELPWVTGFVETLLMRVWYPITVATKSLEIYKIVDKYAKISGGSVSPFHLNDFGYRGVSSEESACLGGAAHLTVFAGTDTLGGIKLAKDYYHATGLIGASVMATEHSTTTTYGKENELEAYQTFLNRCPDDAILSIVADSYDFENAVDYMLGQRLADQIVGRKGRVVVRPDSGDPLKMSMYALKSLENRFGATKNAKGFKLLNPKVGVIYGDGIDEVMIENICKVMVENGYAVDAQNMIFGMGGGLLQKCNRDTYSFAFKCCHATVNGEGRDVFKEASGKSSKRGRLKLIDGNITVPGDVEGEDLLQFVYMGGSFAPDQTFADIRARVHE